MKRLLFALAAIILYIVVSLDATYSLLVHAASTATDGDTTATTDAVDSTGADTCIYGLADYSVNGPATVTDSKSNTITNLTASSAPISEARLSYAKSATVGSSHTAQATAGSTTYPSLGIACFSGGHLTAPADQQNGATTSGATTLATGSVTPSENDELVITVLSSLATSAVSIDNGFTILDQIAYAPGESLGIAFAYKIQTTAAAVNPTWTLPASVDAATRIATFKMAGGGAAPKRNQSLMGIFGQ